MMMKIAICALTHKRPDGLKRLLEGLTALQVGEHAVRVEIILVDNDPDASARKTCIDVGQGLPWPVKYVVEPQPGIANARNAALETASDAEWVAFIDDDEVPTPQWLAELVRTQHQYDADVVAGPVVPLLPASTPDWIRDGGFFDRRRFRTGQRLTHAFTNNVIFRRSILSELALRFDPRLALIGGEDRHFFQQIGMAGYKIVWADNALVTEWVSERRATARWLLQRAYRVGTATAFVEMDLRSKWKIIPLLLAKGGVWLLIGLGTFAAGLFAGNKTRLRGKRGVAYGLGLLSGLLGFRYEEYRKGHSNCGQ